MIKHVQNMPNGEVIYFTKNNLFHSENNQPAYIKYDKNRNIVRLEWYKNGVLHNDNDIPAIITYDNSGKVIERHWYVEGRQSRPSIDLPDCIINHYWGDITYKWNLRRALCKNQPYDITYYNNGAVKEKYFSGANNILYIAYQPDGTIDTIKYNTVGVILTNTVHQKAYYHTGVLKFEHILNYDTSYTKYYNEFGDIKKIHYYNGICNINTTYALSHILIFESDKLIYKYVYKNGDIIKKICYE